MSSIETVPTSSPAMCSKEVNCGESSGSTGQVIQRKYVLNDIGALKKKVRNETRTEPYDQGTEAKNGSNVVVLFKTSFFKNAKNHFIKDLIQMEGINNIQNVIATKANSESSGDAFVELSVEVNFTVESTEYAVKAAAYTTSCKIMFQPLGSPPSTKVNSTQKAIPRYFVDKYFLPWCEKAYKTKISTKRL